MPHGQWVAFEGYDTIHECSQSKKDYATSSRQNLWNDNRNTSLGNKSEKSDSSNSWISTIVVIAIILIILYCFSSAF
jgi:hypothetical protein